MQIIAGKARRIVLDAPPGLAVRPTSGRAREALFSSLGDFSGMSVADLFAGSGALGLEAASRGAARVAFVEKERRHLACIETNGAKVSRAGAECELQLIPGDVMSGAFRRIRFTPELIFCDPPYADSAVFFQKLMPALVEWAPEARIVWELPDSPGAAGDFLRLIDADWQLRRFGSTDFLLRRPERPAAAG